MKTILLGTDGSPASKHATELAVALAKATGAPLAVVTGWVLPGATLAFSAPFDVRELEDAERARADRAVRAAVTTAEQAGIAATGAIVADDPVDAIFAEATRLDAGLIVVGSRGWSTARKLLLGSVSLAVLGHADRPVLVVRSDIPVELEHPKILLASDGSDAAHGATTLAIDLARETGWPLHVVSAWSISPTSTTSASGVLPDLIKFARKHAEDVLAGLAAETEAAGVELHHRVVGGPPAASICEEAAELQPTLLVVGTRGLGAGKRFLFGSVSNRVVHEAPCPVLVTRVPRSAQPKPEREVAAIAH